MPVGVQCPISSSLGEFPSYWDWLWCPGLSPVGLIGVHRPSLRFPHLVFSIRSYLPLDLNRVSSLRPTYPTHSVDPALTHFLAEFPGLGLALVPDVVVTEADSGAHGAENSIQISALAGVEPRTLALDYRAPLLLVASYDMQESTAGQFQPRTCRGLKSL